MHTVYCWRCGHEVVCTAEMLPLYLKGDVLCPCCGYAEGFAPADDNPLRLHRSQAAALPSYAMLPTRPVGGQWLYQAA